MLLLHSLSWFQKTIGAFNWLEKHSLLFWFDFINMNIYICICYFLSLLLWMFLSVPCERNGSFVRWLLEPSISCITYAGTLYFLH